MENNYPFDSILLAYIESLTDEFDQIPEKRKNNLQEIGKYVLNAYIQSKEARLLFICTHNSRRSQFGQLWAQTAAFYYGLTGIKTYSGGTEVTAFNHRVVDTLKRTGFTIIINSEKKNKPKYTVKPGKHFPGFIMYSKKYDNEINPVNNFCAVMVCSDADEACPVVTGAGKRISLPYNDPKEFDGTFLEKEKYDDCCREIAREMFFTMDYVKEKIDS